MPKKNNIQRVSTGADISDVADLHCLLVEAAKAALKAEMDAGEIKPQTMNVIRQLCTDSGIQPTQQATHALDALRMSLPSIDAHVIPDLHSSYAE
jgi:tryptophan synthase beta subunit